MSATSITEHSDHVVLLNKESVTEKLFHLKDLVLMKKAKTQLQLLKFILHIKKNNINTDSL